jgi:hypothetical protein
MILEQMTLGSEKKQGDSYDTKRNLEAEPGASRPSRLTIWRGKLKQA